jgi:hypothetical protein
MQINNIAILGTKTTKAAGGIEPLRKQNSFKKV